MPAKRTAARARAGKASPREDVVADTPESFDIASLPMDDAAATPQQSSPPQRLQSPAQKVAKRESQQQQQRGTADSAAASATASLLPTSPHATLGESEPASLAEAALQSLVDGTATVGAVSDSVLAVYRTGDKEHALCAVLNVLAKASGVAEVELDANALVDGVELRPLLEELYARVPEDSEAYLLANKEARYRRFRRSFPEWCARLVQDGFAADVLLDPVFMPVLSQWVVAMSESKSRSFRHTATVALLGFVQGLSNVAADLQSQLALLRTKKDITAVQRKRDDVVEWRDHIFSQAVHQRLRDIAPDIRLAGFQALRRWILEFPDEFMTNKYLRYLGMPLHDKRPELRAEALDTVLQALARVPDAYSRLHLFLQYFTNRLVELSNDVDVRCTELAIRVVAMMVRGDSDVPEGSELLSNEKVDQVLLTLFDERPTIRAAAGILLKVFIHCRTAAEESEAAQVSVATELLCSFAATLRTQYREAMPERYLVDAVWTPERPPLLLTAYAPMLAAAQSDKPLDAVVGLQLVAALLLKVQGRLTLGPLPKDDRRGGNAAAAPAGAAASVAGNKKISPAAREEAEALVRRLSEEAAQALCSILEVHRCNEDVLHAAAEVCAALDLSSFTSQHHHTALSALLIELRRATLLSPCTSQEGRASLVRAWHHLTFTEHPLRNEAQAHVEELLKSVAAQLARATRAPPGRRGGLADDRDVATHAWARMHLVSGLCPLEAHWPAVRSAAVELLSTQPAAVDASLALLVVSTALQGLLWQVAASSPAVEAGAEAVAIAAPADALAAVLQYQVETEEALQTSGAPAELLPLTEMFVQLCDLLALPLFDLAQAQQETVLRLFRGLYEQTSSELRSAQEALKLHVHDHRAAQHQRQEQQPTASAGLAGLVAARRLCSRTEALQLRLAAGVARLFLLGRLDSVLAATFLSLWTQTPSKAVSDAFKSLFHALRDRLGDDGFLLERDVLLACYHHCAEVGATPVSVEALGQTGLKLSSLHFGGAGTDRWYTCCPAVVRFGAEFAASTDPLLLQAVTPYAARLRPADALHVLRDQLSQSKMFAEATNPYVRTFVAALRRAAKLDDSTSALSAAGAGKRPRALAGATELADEEGMLDAIARGLSGGAAAAASASSAASRTAGRGQRISVANRVVTADGWHVRAGVASQSEADDVVEVAMSQQGASASGAAAAAAAAASSRASRSVVNVPSTQETALSSMADGLDNDEVFVATEEFE